MTASETIAAPRPEPLTPWQELTSLVNRLAAEIADENRLSSGDRAALRRLRADSRDPGNAAFWRLLAHRLEPSGTSWRSGLAQDEAERRWSVVLAAMAELEGLHQPGRRLGQALAEAVSEARFSRLLRSHGNPLLDQVRVLAHLLAAKAQRFDQADLVRLVLSDDRWDEETERRRLARDFYRNHS